MLPSNGLIGILPCRGWGMNPDRPGVLLTTFLALLCSVTMAFLFEEKEMI
jgi:hypothetical protein